MNMSVKPELDPAAARVPSLSLMSPALNVSFTPPQEARRPASSAQMLRAESFQAPLLTTGVDGGGSDILSPPFTISAMNVQPTPRSAHLNVKRTRCHRDGVSVTPAPLNCRRLSTCAQSCSGWSALVGGGAAIPSRTSPEAPKAKAKMVCNGAMTNGDRSLSVPLLGADAMTSAAALVPPDGRMGWSASLPEFHAEHADEEIASAPRALQLLAPKKADVGALQRWSSSLLVSTITTRCVSPLSPEQPSVKPLPSYPAYTGLSSTSTPHNRQSHRKSPSTPTTLITKGTQPPRQTWARFSVCPADSAEDAPPTSMSEREPCLSLHSTSLCDARARHGYSSPVRGGHLTPGNETVSDMTGTPPHFASSGFFSGPAYQCFADASDQFSSASMEPNTPVSLMPHARAVTSHVPSPSHRNRRAVSMHGVGKLLEPQPNAAQPPRAQPYAAAPMLAPSAARASAVVAGSSSWTLDGSGREGSRPRRAGPLIELLSCCSSDDEGEEEPGNAAREKALAQRSAADLDAFATRYKAFLREHLAVRGHTTTKSSSPSRPWPAHVTLATTAGGLKKSSSVATRTVTSPLSADDSARHHVLVDHFGVSSGSQTRRRWVPMGGAAAGSGGTTQHAESRSSMQALFLSEGSVGWSGAAFEGDATTQKKNSSLPAVMLAKLNMHLASFSGGGERSTAAAVVSRSRSLRNSGGVVHVISDIVASRSSRSGSLERLLRSSRVRSRSGEDVSAEVEEVTPRAAAGHTGMAGYSGPAYTISRAPSLTDLRTGFGHDRGGDDGETEIGSKVMRVYSFNSAASGLHAQHSGPPNTASGALRVSCFLPLDSASTSSPAQYLLSGEVRVSDASKFTIGEDDGSTCTDTW